MINNIEETITKEETDVDSLKKLMNELGISSSTEKSYNLLIWNDDVNDMMYVVESLSEICKLPSEECVKIMFEAHINGKAVAKKGSYDELVVMKDELNLKKINATIEE